VLALLGPNGGGKTTLFRILSTAILPQSGNASIFGISTADQPAAVRRAIGVVFQAPSLDKKLTAAENLWHHGHLYGMRGGTLRGRIAEMLAWMDLSDRASDRVQTLSGGMQRRVELAKGLLHRPRLLLMDEPSTGLDPGARRDLWAYLRQARQRDGITILLTTHLMDEAEQCDRVGILHQGELVAMDSPQSLTRAVGDEVITLEARDAGRLAQALQSRLGIDCTVFENSIRMQRPRGHELVAQLYREFPEEIRAVTVRNPTLEDVFIHHTGRSFWEVDEPRGSN
jgi:ABC-2 type transport system ATP-binding protein